MLPWIIGGVIVAVVGAALSESEEQARKKSEEELKRQRRRQNADLQKQARQARMERIEKSLHLLERELGNLRSELDQVERMLKKTSRRTKIRRGLIAKRAELMRHITDRQFQLESGQRDVQALHDEQKTYLYRQRR